MVAGASPCTERAMTMPEPTQNGTDVRAVPPSPDLTGVPPGPALVAGGYLVARTGDSDGTLKHGGTRPQSGRSPRPTPPPPPRGSGGVSTPSAGAPKG
jgi:hypothetical protein